MTPSFDGRASSAGGLARRERPVVLHVDDDVASLMMAEGALEEAGFDVVQAGDGSEAIERFRDHDPDLIIMDAVMPVMDGFESIARVRQLDRGAHVPILMITGLDDLDSITRAYDVGATDFLAKPINFFILPHRVQYMLRAKATADALRASQEKLDNAQRIARLGHWEWHPSSGALSWSREFGRILGLASGELSGDWDGFVARVAEGDREELAAATRLAVGDARAVSLEFGLVARDGHEARTVRLEAEPGLGEGGQCTYLLGTLQDITERTDAQAQIHTLAYYDLVTGLPNRAQLHEQLRIVLRTSVRTREEFALLFLDLDHFKQVNDTLGHDAGDDLLRQVAERLLSVVRGSDTIGRLGSGGREDGPEHTVARLGGDEFVVLLGRIGRAEDAARVARRIAASIGETYTIGETEVGVTTTIGISVYPADGEDAETLLKHADVAMYHAKERGRNGYQFYSRGIHEKALARFSMERELREGIEDGQLVLVYQPKVRLVDGTVCGAEALVRWNHPEKGEINPSDFIPLAEETGLILPIGQWVLREACAQRQRWTEAGMEPFPIAINCSAVQFTRGDVIGDIDGAVADSGLDPRWLEVELTESLLLQDIDAGIDALERMKRLGIQVAIDDFGTGFSSLSYLKRLPVDKLKVDQSFVKDLATDTGDAAIVSAIVTLSRNLGLTVVAEGVETEEQYDILQSYGCHEAQGYLISWPMTVPAFERWLDAHERPRLGKVSGL